MNVERAYIPTSQWDFDDQRQRNRASYAGTANWPNVCRLPVVTTLNYRRIYCLGVSVTAGYSLNLDLVCRLNRKEIFRMPVNNTIAGHSFGFASYAASTGAGVFDNISKRVGASVRYAIAPVRLNIACDEIALVVNSMDAANLFDFFLGVLSNNGV